ncbi:MAG: 50S ribosomal protein L25/general stress protein Ctc [Crocinitomicaceae bacterium]|nr:50S ribosomal protein L25/general stress protein Ctc [Crocinitomicaceae bacterium]
MKEVSLSGSLRENVGKKDATAVRNAGRVPCVVYGTGVQTHFSVRDVDMDKLVYTPEVYIVNIDIDGKKVKTIIQDVQHHPVTDKVHHVDFIELQDNKKVKVEIPIRLTGRSMGVMNGGKLSQVFRKLRVYAVPGALPDIIEVDITNLRIGQSIRVRDIAAKTGLDILNAPSAVICSVKMARGAVANEEEEGGAEEEAAPAEAAPAEEAGE